MILRARSRTVFAFAAVAALAMLPSRAAAATTTATAPLDAIVTACNGDPVHLTGQLLGVFTFTVNNGGGAVVATHVQPQGVSGTDLNTGTAYLGTGQTSDRLVVTPSGGTTFTFIDRFHIQATAGADSLVLTTTFHVTTLPDGTVTAFVSDFSASC